MLDLNLSSIFAAELFCPKKSESIHPTKRAHNVKLHNGNITKRFVLQNAPNEICFKMACVRKRYVLDNGTSYKMVQ